jgi:hypothetical protein
VPPPSGRWPPPALSSIGLSRVERRLNPLTGPPPTPSERALALHATLRAVDLHADSLLFGRDLLVRGDRGHVDLPRMVEGGVALQVLSAAVKTPRPINIERNDDRTDDVTRLALAARWPPRTWTSLRPGRCSSPIARTGSPSARAGRSA